MSILFARKEGRKEGLSLVIDDDEEEEGEG